MNTDRLGKLLEAWRLAVENAVNDGGVERATREEEIQALIGGVEAAPDPWPDTVRKASEAPDMDAAWRLLVDALCLPVVCSSGEWRDEPDPDPVIWRDHAQYPDAVLSSGEVAILSGGGQVREILHRPGAGCCGGSGGGEGARLRGSLRTAGCGAARGDPEL